MTGEGGGVAPTAGVERLLAVARESLHRLTPREAYRRSERGEALLVDTRPESHRREEGIVPGAVVVERNVLEWRFDPAGAHRAPEFTGPEQTVVLICDEGYASSLAAATLQQLGVRHATDVIGGFRGWRTAGLPVV